MPFRHISSILSLSLSGLSIPTATISRKPRAVKTVRGFRLFHAACSVHYKTECCLCVSGIVSYLFNIPKCDVIYAFYSLAK